MELESKFANFGEKILFTLEAKFPYTIKLLEDFNYNDDEIKSICIFKASDDNGRYHIFLENDCLKFAFRRNKVQLYDFGKFNEEMLNCINDTYKNICIEDIRLFLVDGDIALNSLYVKILKEYAIESSSKREDSIDYIGNPLYSFTENMDDINIYTSIDNDSLVIFSDGKYWVDDRYYTYQISLLNAYFIMQDLM